MLKRFSISSVPAGKIQTMKNKNFIGFLALSMIIHLAVFGIAMFTETGLRIELSEMEVSLVSLISPADIVTPQPEVIIAERPEPVKPQKKPAQVERRVPAVAASARTAKNPGQAFLDRSEISSLKEALLAAPEVKAQNNSPNFGALPDAPGSELVKAVPHASENRPPEYPSIARRRGWEGEVWLMVRVANTGRVLQVQVDSSSGYNILDQTALEAVRAWHFRAARFGAFAVEGEVMVPVRFELRDS